MNIDHAKPLTKNATLGQRGEDRVTWPTFEILGPSPYLRNG